MGLLEKAQQRKQALQGEKKHGESLDSLVEKRLDSEYEEVKEGLDTKVEKTKGLLEKAKLRRQEIYSAKGGEKKSSYTTLPIKDEGKEVIEEKTGFGWKGLGTRRIVYDHSINEYVYEVIEPVLNKEETELKNELTRLFKMLSDVDVSNVVDEKEKAKYLEETLERIIVDNNIRFDVRKKQSKPIGSGFKSLFKHTTYRVEGKEEKNDKTGGKHRGKKPLLFLRKKGNTLTPEEQELKDKIFYHIFREFLGYGKIDIVMKDDGIEDISCDGHHVPIFIYHKKYDAIPTNIWFENEEELDSFVVRLAQLSGKQISVYSPIVDGKLPDGSRLQTTLAKTVTRGSTFTIRKFKEKPLTPVDLIDYGSLSLDMAAYFWLAIENGASILFCGGTASGKTTALNALSLFIPAQHKIISIEDTREVNLPHKNWIADTTREGFTSSDHKTGKDIDMFDLIRAALRQRPKVVIVGEVRGREAYSLFQAMATGHTSYATVHASDIHTLIQRLENPPISLPRALLTSLDIIVFQNAVDIAGKTVRRMTSVTEVVKLDPDTNQLIFMEPFRWVSKTDDRFESSGASKILNDIRLQNDWTEKQLQQEIENRKLVLQWMLKNNLRNYKDVGRIVAEYNKNPTILLKKVREELKR
ncbi:MAG: secretion system protein E [Thermoplasmata archaeon]|nr:MAG: secretion system protein E [Thermoplasmata archaeon]RLF35840.1 MAG: secretion system protein E [Thermoplasmata archaeon]